MQHLKIDTLRQQQRRVSYLQDPYQRQEPRHQQITLKEIYTHHSANGKGPDSGHTLARHPISHHPSHPDVDGGTPSENKCIFRSLAVQGRERERLCVGSCYHSRG